MRVSPTELEGVLLIEPRVHRDGRGFFFESYHEQRYRDAGIDVRFVQDNHSRSQRFVLRGLHAQWRHPQGKLVRASRGEIFDVAVDIRPSSPTFRAWVGVHLSAENCRQLYIPAGFAHGFCTLSEVAEVQYKCTAYYHPEDEITIAWNDPEIAVDWPVDEPRLSDKDRHGRLLSEVVEMLAKSGP
ncbi:MAG: dTDP-4-dehydrorhamnose 3,5-epimerase [Acidobacteriota bacterium]|nr:dTDP-4-dehydrorhamnose 3,5-epimerase [Acidobacteriota bacterium]